MYVQPDKKISYCFLWGAGENVVVPLAANRIVVPWLGIELMPALQWKLLATGLPGKSFKLFSRVAVPMYIPNSCVLRDLIAHILFCLCIKTSGSQMDVKWYSLWCVFAFSWMLMRLSTSSCLLVRYIFPSGKSLFISFVHLSIVLYTFLLIDS